MGHLVYIDKIDVIRGLLIHTCIFGLCSPLVSSHTVRER
jgi:hypothetical protein